MCSVREIKMLLNALRKETDLRLRNEPSVSFAERVIYLFSFLRDYMGEKLLLTVLHVEILFFYSSEAVSANRITVLMAH